MVDADADTNTFNSKVESAKKDNANANRDNDEDDAKIKSSSSSSEIAKTEGIGIDIDIDIIYQETFTPWFVPLLFIAAPLFYKYGIIIYKNKNQNTNTNIGKDADADGDGDGGTNMKMEQEQEQEQSRITFGYGMKGPAITAGSGGLSSLSPSYWTSHTVSLENIDQASITVGTASALDNLTTFGGWGIRLGRVRVANTKDSTSIIMSSSSKDKASYTFTRAYNACNGPYCEFTELIQEGSSRSASTGASGSGSDDDINIDDQAAPLLKGRRYRIVSTDAEKVASLLRSGSRV